MGITGIWQWIIILAIVLILFGGAGKISAIMGDFGKGLRNFKKGVKDDDDAIDGTIVDMTEPQATAEGEPTPTKAKKAKKAGAKAKKAKKAKKKRAKKAKQ